MTPDNSHPASPANSQIPGVVLLLASLLEILALAHHPTVHTPDIARAVREIGTVARAAAVVHGVLIALMLVIAYGLSEMVVRLGASRAWMRAGSMAYALGIIVMTGAAVTDGWLIAGVASDKAVSPVDYQMIDRLLSLCSLIVQTCASIGAVGMSAGIALWSLQLLRGPGAQRWVGTLGCMVGALIIAALGFGVLHLDLHGMMLVVLLQTLWGIAVAVLLVRNQI